MAKVPFTVDNGLVPSNTDVDLGSSSLKFRDSYISNNANIDGDVVIESGGEITVGGAPLASGGGGIDESTAIAYSIALG